MGHSLDAFYEEKKGTRSEKQYTLGQEDSRADAETLITTYLFNWQFAPF
jgi:hypothetical protein